MESVQENIFQVTKNDISAIHLEAPCNPWYNISLTIQYHMFTFSFYLDHIPDYFKWYGRTFRHTTGEIIETVHSKLKTLEQKHQLRVKTSVGTIYHKQRLRKSICLWNFKVLGPIQELETTPTGPEVIGAAVALLDHSYH